ncbi:trk system potassium uptake protein TrkH [Desulfonauticus submarinus]|uniref:Trk system potassium uptake protein TrkH n=1 Tax=Desulfonauticus submarinus TaxID=206665 RepID=A0A1H0A543_9BACT|nr:potassium transporter TrkG [Desulfonauticus submarinus]SDN28083.1 trk system potassium uptake protein TrkH [Desulfonauticus submarinus]
MKKNFISPFSLPVYFFALTILIGAIILHHPISLKGNSISWLDALFTATSATCVTGLIVVDTGSFFSPFGQGVILTLIQLGGLGIMTYTSLVFYLWRKKISITDRIAVGQSLLHDPSFHLGKFLTQMIQFVFFIELGGALLLYLLDPIKFSPFSAIFHSISAFCNAGFSLFSSSLIEWQSSFLVNLIFIILIVSGGLGFAVILEIYERKIHVRTKQKLSWHSKIVLETTLALIVGGTILIFIAEFFAHPEYIDLKKSILTSFFQSITCRTAGFNTVEIDKMTNLSLLIMIFLMFIGGSPGSCAGGIKTTTFRTFVSFGWSNLIGRKQCVIGKYALDDKSLNKALTLIIFAMSLIFLATAILLATEGGDIPHHLTKGLFLEILFEVVSAFGTVGLSVGLTPNLSVIGKMVIIALMFIGRLGPILFLTLLQSWQSQERFKWPENTLLIG